MKHSVLLKNHLFLAAAWLIVMSCLALFTPEAVYASVRPPQSPDESNFSELLFIPTIKDGWALRTFDGFAEVSADGGTVDLCVASSDRGQEIEGHLPGQPTGTVWAGVLNVTLNGTEQKAFCTDIHNGISGETCFSNSTIGAADPLVACMVQYYPPVGGLSKEEAAARQAAVWYFSDGFEVTSPPLVKSIFEIFVAVTLARQATGQCDALLTPTVAVSPSSAVNFLASDGNDGFLSSSHEYTVTVKKGAIPVANQPVTVTTDLGTLSHNGSSGTTLNINTDANGEAIITISHNATGTATIVAETVLSLPVGTRIDPNPTTQKIVVSGSEQFTLQASATKQWVAGGNLVIQKFHDKDRNGLFNSPPDELIDWQVRYRQQDGDDFTGGGWTDLTLGADGSETIDVQLGVNYQVCEVTQVDWAPTTPTCFAGVTAGDVVRFGNAQLPALLIIKYHDRNGNGTRDMGEEGLEGWQYEVERFENNFWSASYSGQTNSGGNLGFSDVLYPFDYRAIEVMQNGWYSSTPTLQAVSITVPGLYTLTFGNLQPGSLIINKSWFSNNNPVESPEPATICMERIPLAPTQTLTPTVNGIPLTLADDKYCTPVEDSVTVENLWPGDYVITESPLPGWIVNIDSQDISIVSGVTNTVAFRNDRDFSILAALGDRVWHDLNDNGLQDTGEPGVGDVTVNLLEGDCSTATGMSTTTDSNGIYGFGNLQPGSYCVEFVLDSLIDFSVTQRNAGNDALDSDADPVTGKSNPVTLAGGETNLTIDAGLVSRSLEITATPLCVKDAPYLQYAVTPVNFTPGSNPVTIRWLDVDNDNVLYEFTGQPLSGTVLWPEAAVDSNGVGIQWPGWSLVNGVWVDNGSNLRPQVKVQILVNPSETITVDYPPATPTCATAPRAALGDRVWVDSNKNGIQDPGEENVPGVEVNLYTAAGVHVSTDTTDINGNYLFTGLMPGTYYVEFATVAGYTFTNYNIGGASQDAVDSDPLVPLVDLNISDGGLEATLGQPFTFTLFYSNTDTSLTAQNIVISTTVPVGTNFAPDGSGWQCPGGAVIAGVYVAPGVVCSYTIPTLAPNSSGSVQFIVEVVDDEDALPDSLDLLVSLGQATVARTENVSLEAGETDLTVDAGIVLLEAGIVTPTSLGPTSLPDIEQPAAKQTIFLPSLHHLRE